MKVAITGGGPAGSSLAIHLASRGFETVLVEKETFPREKLCGEFISPECLRHFEELGVLDRMTAAGGDRIHETRFFETGGRNVVVPSEWFSDAAGFALGLSRAEMDSQLLQRAKELGVEVHEGTSVTNLEFDAEFATRMIGRTTDGAEVEIDADIFIDATGRVGTLGRLAEQKRSLTPTKPTIVGFKTHITEIDLERGVCEIYSFPGGYAGLSYVEGERANLCFLIKAETVKTIGSDPRAIVDAIILKNKRAAQTLRHFVPDEWLAVSINGFGTKRVAPAPNVFSVGDAAAFIDPFTGSGMVMAMESSAVLSEAIGNGNGSLNDLAIRYAASYRSRFGRRLKICSVLRRTAFMPRLATAVVAALGVSTSARRILARSTRG